jgi:4'-phosphopantetheinyl transferase
MHAGTPAAEAARSPIRVFWTDIEAPWPPVIEGALAARLPEFLAARARRYRHWQDRQARLAARGLLMAALADAGLPTELGALTWTDQGRPKLPVRGDFNIAHSAGRVLCAWADRGAIGIDVEHLRPVDPEDYASVLSPAEQRQVAGASEPSRAFLQIWIVKEAIAKAAGSGLIGESLPDTSAAPPIRFASRAWHLTQWEDARYVTALATDLDTAQVEWISMRLDPNGQYRADASDTRR